MHSFIVILFILQVLITGAYSLVPQLTKNVSQPRRWLKPLVTLQKQNKMTKYALVSSILTPELMPSIVAGTMVNYEQIPHQAHLLIDNSFLCGGALISTKCVATAAHCVQNRENFVVTLGTVEWTLATEPSRWSVLTTTKIIHEKFNSTTFLNDIALLIFSQDAPLSTYIYPIALPRYQDVSKTLVGYYATVSGWGWTSNDGEASSTLNYIQLLVISNQDCMNTYGTTYIFPTSLCGLGSGLKSTCRGDSGGPLTAVIGGQRKLVGLVSFGLSSCEDGYPQVFTRMTAYLNWISSRIGIRISP